MTPDETLQFLTANGFNALDFPIMRVTALTHMISFSLAMPENERWIDVGKLSTGLSLWVLAYHDTIEKIIDNILDPENICTCSRCKYLENDE